MNYIPALLNNQTINETKISIYNNLESKYLYNLKTTKYFHNNYMYYFMQVKKYIYYNNY